MLWQSKLQKDFAFSSTKVKYIAIDDTYKEMFWLMSFFKDLKLNQDEYVIYCDS